MQLLEEGFFCLGELFVGRFGENGSFEVGRVAECYRAKVAEDVWVFFDMGDLGVVFGEEFGDLLIALLDLLELGDVPVEAGDFGIDEH